MSVTKIRLAPEVLTLEEAASHLTLPRPRFYRLASLREVPAQQVDREWQFLKSALDKWLEVPMPRDNLV
jgi:excisionase family DNA binding protein